MLLGAVAPYAVRLSVRTVEEAGPRRRAPVRDLDARLAGRASSSARSCSSRSSGRGGRSWPSRWRSRVVAVLGAAAALRARARSRVGAAARDPGRDGQGDRRRARDLGRARPSTSTRGSSRSADGERRLELNEGQAVHSVYRPGEWLTGDYWDEMLVLPFAAGARAAALGRDPRQRRGHDRARLRPLLPGDARRRGGDRRRADRRRAPAVRPARAEPAPAHAPTRGRSCAGRPRAGTRSSSTPTASPTSPSTWRRASSSRSCATA